MSRIKLQAPAKINLGLHVLRKRPDGFHEIETIMQMVSLFDDLVMEEGENGIQVVTEQADLPSGKENLVYRAAELLSRETGRTLSARIRLIKRIPIAAGLGGGSSDAAAALVGLNRLWGLRLPTERLMEIAGKIGMDVPFFLFSPTALGRERGEILERLTPPSPPFWILLVNPQFNVSTKWAYEGLKLGLTIKNKHISIRRFTITAVGNGSLENDLEEVTFKEHPVLQEIKDSLKRYGALEALMSGSGPTIFGLFPDNDTAQEARQGLANRQDLRFFLVRTLSAFPAIEL
jgi:4-diphosphocytidyl-2-C-methyl-D-erythritol kinase